MNINIYLEYIWLDERSYENILFYDITYKMSYGAEPLRIIFDKADEKYKKLFERIRYLSR